MNTKPDFKSYAKRQQGSYPYFIKCKTTGLVFYEVHGVAHRRVFSLIQMLICLSVFYFPIINVGERVYFGEGNIDELHQMLVIIFLLEIAIIVVFEVITTRLLYRFSKFEVIAEQDLEDNPDLMELLNESYNKAIHSKKKK